MGTVARLLTPPAPDLQALLLLCLHADAAEPAPARLAGLDAAAWQELTSCAVHLRVAGPVHERLRTLERRTLVPNPCLERLQRVVRGTLIANLQQQAMLGCVLKECDAADIPVILFKGLWLAERVYRDLTARAGGDMDVLIRPRDVPRFTAVARELGFEVPAGVSSLRDIAPAVNEGSLVHRSHRIVLDVHWSLTHSSCETAIDEDTLWQRVEWTTLAGRQCRTLRLEDHLLFLCFHAVDHHRFTDTGPRAMLDVARLIGAPPRPLDWDDVVACAHARRWSRGVWLLLDLVREHLGVQPPQDVLAALRPAHADDPAIRVAALAELVHPPRPGGNLNRNLVRLSEQSVAGRRAALIWRRLFPAREDIATYFQTTIDDPAIPWLYVKRVGLMLKAHAPQVGQLLLKDRARASELDRARTIARWLER